MTSEEGGLSARGNEEGERERIMGRGIPVKCQTKIEERAMIAPTMMRTTK